VPRSRPAQGVSSRTRRGGGIRPFWRIALRFEHSMHQVIIIGGGISGLSLAYRLQQADPALEVTVLEQRDRPGGTLWTERRDGFQVEIGPNGFLDSKPTTLALCRDVGLGDRLLAASDEASRNRYLFLDGRLRRLPNRLGTVLRTHLLGWRGKLALLGERFRPRR